MTVGTIDRGSAKSRSRGRRPEHTEYVLVHPLTVARSALDRARVRRTAPTRRAGIAADEGLPKRRRGAERFRVLWATDDSDTARVGEGWILRLRWSSPPLVDILCVATRRWRGAGLSLQTYRTAVQDAVGDLRQGELMTAMRTANKISQRLQGTGLLVHVWARHGDPAEEIAALVRSEHPDLVVVSPRGRKRPLLPGPTVTEQVIRKAEVATLVARPSATEEGELPRQILLAVTDERLAQHALGWLVKIGWLRESRVTLVGLADREKSTGDKGAPLDVRAAMGPVSEAALERLAAVAGADAGAGGVDTRILPGGPPAEQLLETLGGRPIDLVAVLHPRPGQRYDFAETIASSAPVSVLVMPGAPGRRSSELTSGR
jgi:nucleotide-binding universal stress UspA family protein